QYDWSINLLERATALRPNDADLNYSLAKSQFASGRLDAAEKILPLLPDTDADAGLAALVTAFAEKESLLATSLPTRDPDPLVRLAAQALQSELQGDPDLAKRRYLSLLKIAPNFRPAMRSLALIYHKQAV